YIQPACLATVFRKPPPVIAGSDAVTSIQAGPPVIARQPAPGHCGGPWTCAATPCTQPLLYRNIRRVVFDYPSFEPWYMRYTEPGSSPIDDWLADELTAADDKFPRHEILFSSGTTLLVEFMDVSIRTTRTV